MAEISSGMVWKEIKRQIFGVLGMVTSRGEARTVGIVYVVHKRRLYIASKRDTWKVRHVGTNPHVALTIPIAKRIPLLPWIKIPAATITFSGVARVCQPDELAPEVLGPLFRGLDISAETSPPFVVIEVAPQGDFVTYGVGVSLMGMRDTQLARGRAPVA